MLFFYVRWHYYLSWRKAEHILQVSEALDLRCLLCCHLVYISKAEFGCGIVGGRLWEK